MRALPLLLAAPVLVGLAACSVKADDKADAKAASVDINLGDDKASAVAGGERGIKIDTDGFKAALDIPGMDIGGKDFDIDGMKLYPGSKVKGVAIRAREKDGKKSGGATFTFTSPATPDAVLVHAEAQAKDADYTVTRSGLTLTGTKEDGDTFTYTVAPAESGTSGTIVMSDTK